MTDDSEPGRIDLHALEVGVRAANADQVIGNAIAESTRMRSVSAADDLQDWQKYLRPALLAAAILIVIAVGAVRATRDASPSGTQVATIADWTETHHLPSNGELLAAFQGYGR